MPIPKVKRNSNSNLKQKNQNITGYKIAGFFYIMNVTMRLKMKAKVNDDLEIYLTGVYQADVGYIANRMDNYYDCNGLSDYKIIPDSPGAFTILTYWNHEPSRREFNNNVQRWVEERKEWKKENNKW